MSASPTSNITDVVIISPGSQQHQSLPSTELSPTNHQEAQPLDDNPPPLEQSNSPDPSIEPAGDGKGQAIDTAGDGWGNGGATWGSDWQNTTAKW
ncbi:hypothetical protein PQX77_011387, partial [Marasmius sp. AFHP31]